MVQSYVLKSIYVFALLKFFYCLLYPYTMLCHFVFGPAFASGNRFIRYLFSLPCKIFGHNCFYEQQYDVRNVTYRQNLATVDRVDLSGYCCSCLMYGHNFSDHQNTVYTDKAAVKLAKFASIVGCDDDFTVCHRYIAYDNAEGTLSTSDIISYPKSGNNVLDYEADFDGLNVKASRGSYSGKCKTFSLGYRFAFVFLAFVVSGVACHDIKAYSNVRSQLTAETMFHFADGVVPASDLYEVDCAMLKYFNYPVAGKHTIDLDNLSYLKKMDISISTEGRPEPNALVHLYTDESVFSKLWCWSSVCLMVVKTGGTYIPYRAEIGMIKIDNRYVSCSDKAIRVWYGTEVSQPFASNDKVVDYSDYKLLYQKLFENRDIRVMLGYKVNGPHGKLLVNFVDFGGIPVFYNNNFIRDTLLRLRAELFPKSDPVQALNVMVNDDVVLPSNEGITLTDVNGNVDATHGGFESDVADNAEGFVSKNAPVKARSANVDTNVDFNLVGFLQRDVSDIDGTISRENLLSFRSSSEIDSFFYYFPDSQAKLNLTARLNQDLLATESIELAFVVEAGDIVVGTFGSNLYVSQAISKLNKSFTSLIDVLILGGHKFSEYVAGTVNNHLRFTQVFVSSINDVRRAVANSVRFAAGSASGTVGSVGNVVLSTAGSVAGVARNVASTVASRVNPEVIGQDVLTAYRAGKTVSAAAVEKVIDAADSIGDKVSKVVSPVVNEIKGDIAPAYYAGSGVFTTASGAAESIRNLITSSGNVTAGSYIGAFTCYLRDLLIKPVAERFIDSTLHVKGAEFFGAPDCDALEHPDVTPLIDSCRAREQITLYVANIRYQRVLTKEVNVVCGSKEFFELLPRSIGFVNSNGPRLWLRYPFYVPNTWTPVLSLNVEQPVFWGSSPNLAFTGAVRMPYVTGVESLDELLAYSISDLAIIFGCIAYFIYCRWDFRFRNFFPVVRLSITLFDYAFRGYLLPTNGILGNVVAFFVTHKMNTFYLCYRGFSVTTLITEIYDLCLLNIRSWATVAVILESVFYIVSYSATYQGIFIVIVTLGVLKTLLLTPIMQRTYIDSYSAKVHLNYEAGKRCMGLASYVDSLNAKKHMTALSTEEKFDLDCQNHITKGDSVWVNTFCETQEGRVRAELRTANDDNVYPYLDIGKYIYNVTYDNCHLYGVAVKGYIRIPAHIFCSNATIDTGKLKINAPIGKKEVNAVWQGNLLCIKVDKSAMVDEFPDPQMYAGPCYMVVPNGEHLETRVGYFQRGAHNISTDAGMCGLPIFTTGRKPLLLGFHEAGSTATLSSYWVGHSNIVNYATTPRGESHRDIAGYDHALQPRANTSRTCPVFDEDQVFEICKDRFGGDTSNKYCELYASIFGLNANEFRKCYGFNIELLDRVPATNSSVLSFVPTVIRKEAYMLARNWLMLKDLILVVMLVLGYMFNGIEGLDYALMAQMLVCMVELIVRENYKTALFKIITFAVFFSFTSVFSFEFVRKLNVRVPDYQCRKRIVIFGEYNFVVPFTAEVCDTLYASADSYLIKVIGIVVRMIIFIQDFVMFAFVNRYLWASFADNVLYQVRKRSDGNDLLAESICYPLIQTTNGRYLVPSAIDHIMKGEKVSSLSDTDNENVRRQYRLILKKGESIRPERGLTIRPSNVYKLGTKVELVNSPVAKISFEQPDAKPKRVDDLNVLRESSSLYRQLLAEQAVDSGKVKFTLDYLAELTELAVKFPQVCKDSLCALTVAQYVNGSYIFRCTRCGCFKLSDIVAESAQNLVASFVKVLSNMRSAPNSSAESFDSVIEDLQDLNSAVSLSDETKIEKLVEIIRDAPELFMDIKCIYNLAKAKIGTPYLKEILVSAVGSDYVVSVENFKVALNRPIETGNISLEAFVQAGRFVDSIVSEDRNDAVVTILSKVLTTPVTTENKEVLTIAIDELYEILRQDTKFVDKIDCSAAIDFFTEFYTQVENNLAGVDRATLQAKSAKVRAYIKRTFNEYNSAVQQRIAQLQRDERAQNTRERQRLEEYARDSRRRENCANLMCFALENLYAEELRSTNLAKVLQEAVRRAGQQEPVSSEIVLAREALFNEGILTHYPTLCDSFVTCNANHIHNLMSCLTEVSKRWNDHVRNCVTCVLNVRNGLHPKPCNSRSRYMFGRLFDSFAMAIANCSECNYCSICPAGSPSENCQMRHVMAEAFELPAFVDPKYKWEKNEDTHILRVHEGADKRGEIIAVITPNELDDSKLFLTKFPCPDGRKIYAARAVKANKQIMSVYRMIIDYCRETLPIKQESFLSNIGEQVKDSYAALHGFIKDRTVAYKRNVDDFIETLRSVNTKAVLKIVYDGMRDAVFGIYEDEATRRAFAEVLLDCAEVKGECRNIVLEN